MHLRSNVSYCCGQLFTRGKIRSDPWIRSLNSKWHWPLPAFSSSDPRWGLHMVWVFSFSFPVKLITSLWKHLHMGVHPWESVLAVFGFLELTKFLSRGLYYIFKVIRNKQSTITKLLRYFTWNSFATSDARQQTCKCFVIMPKSSEHTHSWNP